MRRPAFGPSRRQVRFDVQGLGRASSRWSRLVRTPICTTRVRRRRAGRVAYALNGFCAVAGKIECPSSILLHAVFDTLLNSKRRQQSRGASPRPSEAGLSEPLGFRRSCPRRTERRSGPAPSDGCWDWHVRPSWRTRRDPDFGRAEAGAEGCYGGATRCRYLVEGGSVVLH